MMAPTCLRLQKESFPITRHTEIRFIATFLFTFLHSIFFPIAAWAISNIVPIDSYLPIPILVLITTKI